MPECRGLWRAGADYLAGDFVRPSVANGFDYECTTAGQVNGKKEPNWAQAATVGATFQDGSVVWTCRALSTSSLLRTISTSAWAGGALTIDGAGINNSAGEQQAFAFVSGGVAGTTYRVTNHVVFSDGAEDDGLVDIEVE